MSQLRRDAAATDYALVRMNRRLGSYRDVSALLFLTALVASYTSLTVALTRHFESGVPQGSGQAAVALLVLGSAAIALPAIRRYVATIRSDAAPFRVRMQSSWREARATDLTLRDMTESAGIIVLTVVLLVAFSAFKSLIPRIHHFVLDSDLERMGLAVHGGRHAYTYLLPILGSPLATRAIDAYYYAGGTVVVWGVFVWQVGLRPATRMQYCITFALAWIVLGSLVATVMASAGPMYFGRVVPGAPDPYAPLLDHLGTVSAHGDLLVSSVRSTLWRSYQAQVPLFGGGISAFPSLHVAMAELAAIVGRRSGSRYVAVGLTVQSLVTLAGSIYLGAHYALDGYAAIVGVHVLWRLAGLIA